MTKIIEVSDETFERIKDQLTVGEEMEINSYQDFIGKNVFIRTVTYHYTGKVKTVNGKLMELESAAWHAYQPRLKDFLDGKLDEVEPIGKCWLNIDTIVDIMPYKHQLPIVQS